MTLYLDANIFYQAYCPSEEAQIVDWLLAELEPKFKGMTSEWTIIEIFRALKKQVNLDIITIKEAEIALDFFMSEVGEMVRKEKVTLIPVTNTLLIAAREMIFTKNLYAADALHATTAKKANAKAFITFDQEFEKKITGIQVINPKEKEFKTSIEKLRTTK